MILYEKSEHAGELKRGITLKTKKLARGGMVRKERLLHGNDKFTVIARKLELCGKTGRLEPKRLLSVDSACSDIV